MLLLNILELCLIPVALFPLLSLYIKASAKVWMVIMNIAILTAP